MPYYFDLKLIERESTILLVYKYYIYPHPHPHKKKSFLFSLVHESILRIFKNV